MSIQPASQALFRNDDLRDAIFAHCDKTTLLALVRVDRMCFGVAVRYIWRVVRVSMLEYAWTAGPRTQSYRRAVRCLSKECRPSPSWMITASEYTPFRPNQTRDYPRLRQIFPNLLLVKHQTTCTLGYESDWTLTWCGPDDRWHVQREDTIRLTMCVPTDAWFSCVLPLSPGPNEEAYGIDWHIHLYLRGTPYLHQAQGFIDYLQQCPATLSLVLYRFGAIRTQKEGWAWLDGLACAVAGRPAAGLPPLVTLRLLDPDWPLDSARLWSTLDLVGGHLRDLRLCLMHIRELTVAMETLAHFCPVLDIVRLDVLVDIIECEEAFDTSSGLVEGGGTASQITISLRAPLRSTGSGLVWSTGRPAAFLHRAMARLAAPDCMATIQDGEVRWDVSQAVLQKQMKHATCEDAARPKP